MQTDRKKATLKIRLSKTGKKLAELFIPGEPHPKMLDNIKLEGYHEGSEYQVEFEYQTIKLKGTKHRLIVYRNDEIVYDSHPELMETAKKAQSQTVISSDSTISLIYSDLSNHRSISNATEMAHAPYNFVALNHTVLNSVRFSSNDKYLDERLNGYIEITAIPKTPIFIRSADNLEAFKGKQSDLESNKPINSDFFHAYDEKRIPGSSYRGMVRTLLEIVSWAKFTYFEDKHLYFRAIKDEHRKLSNDYKQKLIDDKLSFDDPQRHKHFRLKYNFKAGYLCFEDGDYFIYPAVQDKADKFELYRIDKNKLTGFHNHDIVYFSTNPITPSADSRSWYTSETMRRKGIDLKIEYATVATISATHASGLKEGTLVISGYMPKKHWQWIINKRDSNSSNKIRINDKAIKAYQDDKNRDDQWDLLKELQKGKRYIPCFYLSKTINSQIEILEFGHTGYFRVKYENSIADHVPKELQNSVVIDLATSLFGSVDDPGFSSRLFFEDLKCKNSFEECGQNIPSILSNPKPTSFQLYLEQSNANGQLNDYNQTDPSVNAPIRGYKLYWHKKNEQWQAQKLGKQLATLLHKKYDLNFTDETSFESIDAATMLKILDIVKTDSDEKHYTVINPVMNGEFKGRIRFENLMPHELGALLFVLDLPKCHYHKIGMGKPLGLGSVEIKPKLILTDKNDHYYSLKTNWANTKTTSSSVEVEEYKNLFASHMLSDNSLDPKNSDKLWNSPRLKELLVLLHWPADKEVIEWNNNRFYPIVDSDESEFKQRRVLPKPTEVLPKIEDNEI